MSAHHSSRVFVRKTFSSRVLRIGQRAGSIWFGKLGSSAEAGEP